MMVGTEANGWLAQLSQRMVSEPRHETMLTLWKKEERFDAEQLKPQAA